MADTASSHITWAALLGRWVEFAKSALAFPDNTEGQRLRQSVPDIIMLQAVTFALGHLDELPDAERALGLDRAEILVHKHAAVLRRRFSGAKMPSTLHQLITDALEQLHDQGRQAGR